MEMYIHKKREHGDSYSFITMAKFWQHPKDLATVEVTEQNMTHNTAGQHLAKGNDRATARRTLRNTKPSQVSHLLKEKCLCTHKCQTRQVYYRKQLSCLGQDGMGSTAQGQEKLRFLQTALLR